MICIKCDNEEFVKKSNATIEQEFRGEQLRVKTTAMACTKCGWTTLTLKQTDELRRLTADAYRQKHGLLTSAQIRSLRKSLAMSQRDFAAFLGVGEASVKRWETWLAQERSSDQLMRLKCETQIRQRPIVAIRPDAYLAPQRWKENATVQQKAEKPVRFSWAGSNTAQRHNIFVTDEELALAA